MTPTRAGPLQGIQSGVRIHRCCWRGCGGYGTFLFGVLRERWAGGKVRCCPLHLAASGFDCDQL